VAVAAPSCDFHDGFVSALAAWLSNNTVLFEIYGTTLGRLARQDGDVEQPYIAVATRESIMHCLAFVLSLDVRSRVAPVECLSKFWRLFERDVGTRYVCHSYPLHSEGLSARLVKKG
jgi:predicted NAD/FAD-dependent oxidoreductase